METYSFSHFSDDTVLRQLTTVVLRERITTAEMLGLIAEVDSRKLYLPLGYNSTHVYCTEALGLTEDTASKRIRAARLGREFPQIFRAVAEGRLSLTGVVMLAPHLNAENIDELLAAVTRKTKHEIERWLAQRSEPSLTPESDVFVVPVQRPPSDEGVVRSSNSSAPGRMTPAPPPQPRRVWLHLAITERAHELLEHGRELLSHTIPSGDMAQVLERLLELGVARLEKRKFAKTDRPRVRRTAANGRTIPSQVRREVLSRDGGRCTFVGSNGHRCGSSRFLEFDHVVPVARGGQVRRGGRSLAAGSRHPCRPRPTGGRAMREHPRRVAGGPSQAGAFLLRSRNEDQACARALQRMIRRRPVMPRDRAVSRSRDSYIFV